METNPDDPYDEAAQHLLAARKLLAVPAAQARTLAGSRSPSANEGAQEMRKAVERLRSQLTRAVKELRELEERAATTQAWHDRHEGINGR
ncbi:hypothetical protein ACWGIR_23245 [Streptomyces albidoflavus]